MHTPCLKEFITPVPRCLAKAPLVTVLELFRQNQCDRLVVVSQQERPQGILYLRNLLPYLIPGHLSSNLPPSLSDLIHSILMPLAILPADLTLEQFWPSLPTPTQATPQSQDSALVDKAGKFLGLLNHQKLLQFLADSELLQKQPNSQILGVRFPERAEEEQHFASEVAKTAHRLLNSFVQFLDRLPLPLMLQTSGGETIRQNLAWRRNFGLLQDPDWLRQEAAALLENSPATSPAAPSQLKPARETNFQPDPTRAALCQLSGNPDTCICVCPMQNGVDRIWQFVKIPLGDVLLDLEGTEAASNGAVFRHETAEMRSFRLAGLGAKEESDYLGLTASFSMSRDLWLVLAQDVTEQQQVAKELAAKNADLVQMNRLKDEFLACISHELKTPLTAVLGLSSLLKDRVVGDLNERQTRYVRLIHQSGRHLMTVVNDILDLTRIETHQIELTLEPVSIAVVCDRAYHQALQQHLSKDREEEALELACPGVHFSLEIEPGLDCLIADELRLRQMLVNLLSNALKFTDVGGSIGLRVSFWEGWIAFSVWDTGIGIPEEKQHLIFQKFQQLENPLTRQYQGTGLGLVLTQRLAHLHGGDVSFISKEGQGSEFTLLLPPCPPDKARGERERESAGDFPIPQTPYPMPQSPSRLVLIVEATTRYIEDLTEKLTSLGYRVAIARSGTEALTKARALQPGAIFLNPVLPLLSGWDVLTLLKASAQTRHIPVIVTATVAEKSQAHANRAEGFLSLPVLLDGLRQQLNGLMKSSAVSGRARNAEVGLTILHLSTGEASLAEGDLGRSSRYTPKADLTRLLHRHQCRILEADDLDQGELLARIWQPQVVLLEGAIANPVRFLQQLSQHPTLAKLPLVTLDRETTQAASQVKGLSVFPCLEPLGSLKQSSALLQAIQVAAGMSWQPNILVIEMAMLLDLGQAAAPDRQQALADTGFEAGAMDYQASARGETQLPPSLRALIQYLQTAGLKGIIAQSWDEVLRHVEQGSVDLLLIDMGESATAPGVVRALCSLRRLSDRPPILVLDRGCDSDGALLSNGGSLAGAMVGTGLKAPLTLTPLLQDIATQVLPASVSMEELLSQIRQALL